MSYELKDGKDQKLHILPCRIRSTAHIDLTTWSRNESESYLRGRHLKCETLATKGYLLKNTNGTYQTVGNLNKTVDWDGGWSKKLSEWNDINDAIME
ncbi:unnamed protein product [Kuraishia capsulata CBS 1993]|uniref:Uncharacterized protein n=1 Tax=Kuraishia capsulata CBS 1993 TaxID=1382522 RepID=W6MT19_9ASCO|nr:uncharacterized protein KUCA_T00005971001 [Kuraishia capsulata CBS 1993]CDK29976.1 unnamed protein product [Kuraishia capsulata CBS 1993]